MAPTITLAMADLIARPLDAVAALFARAVAAGPEAPSDASFGEIEHFEAALAQGGLLSQARARPRSQ